MHIYRQVSRTGLPVQAAGFIEALEPRLLLAAAAPSPPPDGLTIIGDHPQAVTAFAWADVDRDTVTPLLTGKGYVELYFETGVLSKIVLNGTTPATMFSLRVRQFKAAGQTPGDGLIGMGEVADDGTSSLNTLDLSAADLSGTIQMAGTLKTLKLGTYSGPGVSLGGAPADKLSVTARIVDSAANFTFGGQIASLAVTSWAGGLITALGIGTLSVTGGDFGADLDIGAGGIGAINVRGGNLTGTVTTDGAIGNITVTGVASFDAGASSGLVNGGAIRCPLIAAGALKGKSIGNISTSGGGLESVQIRVTGSIGNLNVKSLKYKAEILEEPVLDKYGEPKIDIDGNMVVRKVTVYDYASGGVSVDLQTPCALGNITLEGGDLAGNLDVGSTGTISVQAIISSDMPEAMGGTLSADILADTAIGAITVKGGSITGALSVPNGQIGNIAVTGGDVTGTIIAENGTIGNITVTGVAVFEPDPDNPKLGFGQAVGGNIFSPQIRANAVKGKSIGNITLTGGSLGSADTMVDIHSINGDGETQAGSIGNIVIKSLRYKESVTEEEVELYDRNGDPLLDSEGNPRTRLVRTTTYANQGGGIAVTLDTLGKLGNLTAVGGDLGGLIHAAGGIGDVKVETILQHQTGTIWGIPYTGSMEDVLSASLTATLLADPGATQVGVKSISVLGGDITGELTVTGKVGNITTKCVGEYIEQDPEALPSLTTQGGSLSSTNFHASSFGGISINGGDLSGAVLADNSIGDVTVLYGTLSGSLTATTGSIGNIAVKNVANGLLDPERVAFTGAATAGTTIGAVTVEGGNMTATLTARNAIGNISVKVLTINAEGGWDREVLDGETFWNFWCSDSMVFGGLCEFTIDLGGGDTINTSAKLGTISGTGVDVTVNGTVPWDPSLANLSTRKVSYISAVEGEELTNDNGDVTGRRVNRTTTILPGEEDLVNYLQQPEPLGVGLGEFRGCNTQ